MADPFLEALIYGLRDVKDGSGNPVVRRSKIKFTGTVTDDPTNEQTIVDTAGGSSTVAFDIEKHGGSDINRVRGLNRIAFVDAAGAPVSDGVSPPKGGTWKIGANTGFVAGNPVLPGWADITDYGAKATPIGAHTDADDCTQAFLNAIAAVTATSVTFTNTLHGIVYVPPCPQGFEYYVKGLTNDVCPMPHLEISRTVKIKGVGTGRSGNSGSRIKTGPLFAGFRFVSQLGSSDGGDATGAVVEGLDIYGTRIENTDIVRGWQSNHAYTAGDLIRPHRFHALFFECLVDGTSAGPTPGIGDCTRYATTADPEAGNRWMPGKTYSPGDKVYPNNLCGSTFICTVGGKTMGQNYLSGEPVADTFPDTGERTNCGEPDWFTEFGNPNGTIISPIAESNGPTWEQDEADPEPLWDSPGGYTTTPCFAQPYQPNHAYGHGSQVFATGRFDVIFMANIPSIHTKETSGGSEPVAFATAMPNDPGITDGNITWQVLFPIGIVADGSTFWAARNAGAFMVHAGLCKIESCLIQDHPGSAIGLYSFVGPGVSLFSDFGKIRHCWIFHNGIAIYAHGGDANACSIDDCLMLGDDADYWRDPADFCVLDTSLLGNHYNNNIVQGCSGAAFEFRSAAASGTLNNTYVEGVGRKGHILGNWQVKGGSISSNTFKSSNVDSNCLGGGGPSIYADQATGIYSNTNPDSPSNINVQARLIGNRGTAFGFLAVDTTGDGGDDPGGYCVTYSSPYPGWWGFRWSQTAPALSLSGAAADASVGGGFAWLHRGYMIGNATPHMHWGDNENARSYLWAAADRRYGDTIDRADRPLLARYYNRVNVNTLGGKFSDIWSLNTVYPAGAYVVATQYGESFDTPRTFHTVAGGTSDSTEPTWDTTLGNTTTDNTVEWVAVEGSDFRPMGLVESFSTGYSIQPTVKWADSGDTHLAVVQPKADVRARRLQAQTTTNSASQVIDAGLTLGEEDFTLPEDSVTVVDVTLFVKKNGAADAGSIRLSGTYYRDGAGAPVNVGTDDNVPKLSAGVAGVTAALVINSNAVEVQVSPGSSITLDWRLVRVQYEGTS